ncbi:hypothetical protein C2G38_2033967 [Gigaspora rosea]|uniref:CCHC-type domain-containing protein n=1 Tax=Gigaspora rosea TaxID=44941 RepID=A0A397VPX0_9GLOM|nr:hypothetical protein C2G38_2033967 [Gigaspora rosea]
MSCNTNKLFTPLADLQSERKEVITERKMYGELWENLLTEIQEDVLANDSNSDGEETYSDSNNKDNENDKENELLAKVSLQNPKRRKPKECPKSSKRIKQLEELKLAKRQNQCGNCGEYGHYRPRCSKK